MGATDAFLSRVVTMVRDLAMDPYDAARWTADKIYALVDAVNADVQDELAAAAEPKTQYQFAESTLNIVANQEDYSWPGNFRRFVRLVKKDSQGNITHELLPTQYLSDLSGIIIMDGHRGFRITPVPDTADSGWTLVYESGAIPYLHYGTAASVAASTITLASSPTAGAVCTDDDFYNNSYIRICSGTGAGQIRRVSDYVGSTRVATITPAWTTQPTGAVYEIMPCVRYPDDEAIAWGVVVKMKAADADQTGYQSALNEYHRSMRRVLAKVGNIQKRQGPSIMDSFLDTIDYGDVLL